MFQELAAGQGAKLVIAVAVVGAALFALFIVFRLMRDRASSTFIRGGKNRQPRLAVLDAAAVDAKRRLVLVRRDGVEHLILIGGPTDVVIESGIGVGASAGIEPLSTGSGRPAADLARPAAPAARPVAAVQPQAAPAETAPEPRPADGPAPAHRAAAPFTDTGHAGAMTATGAAASAGPGPLRREEAAADAGSPTVPAGRQMTDAAGFSAAEPAEERFPEQQPSSGGTEDLPRDARADAREQAIDVLDAARTRVLASAPQTAPDSDDDMEFEEDDVDSVFDGPLGEYRQIVADARADDNVPDLQIPATSAEHSTSEPRERMMSDFEALLEAELAGDARSDARGDASGDLSEVNANRASPAPTAPAPAHSTDFSVLARRHEDQRPQPRPENRTDNRPAGDLDDEMDRLLGDLSVRP